MNEKNGDSKVRGRSRRRRRRKEGKRQNQGKSEIWRYFLIVLKFLESYSKSAKKKYKASLIFILFILY